MLVEGFFEPMVVSGSTTRALEELVRRAHRREAARRRGPGARSSSGSARRPADGRRRRPAARRRPRRLPDPRRASSTAHPLVYLDSAATSQKPRAVIEAMDALLARVTTRNVHRGVYELAREADRRVRGRPRADRRVRRAGTRRTTIFTHNATEAINLVAYAWGREQRRRRRRGAHHRRWSTTRTSCPGSCSARRRGAKLRYLEVDERGELSLDELDAELAAGRREAGRLRARLERARHDQPGGGDRARAPARPAP